MNETRKQIIELISDYMEKQGEYTIKSNGEYLKYPLKGCLIELEGKDIGGIYEVIGDRLGYDYNQTTRYLKLVGITEEIISENRFFSDKHGWIKSSFFQERENWIQIKRIIGVYDITAVLKYINIKLGGYKNVDFNENFIEINRGRTYEKFLIKNKPLHLYTQKEEKDLLELLTKFK